MQQRHYILGVLQVSSGFRLLAGFTELRSNVATILRDRRREEGWSQDALAVAVGVARETIVRIEKGTPPSPATLEGLLRVLELDLSEVAVRGVNGRVPRPYDTTWAGEHRIEMGGALRTGRRAEGLSLRVVASRCGVSAAQLSRIERGEASRSRVYEACHEDGGPRAYRVLRFVDGELRRLMLVGGG